MEEEETAESAVKASKRDRLKGAISRTKTKFKRKEIPDGDAGYKPVHDDVEDFLAAGRASTSTGRPSISDSFASGRPSTSDSLTFHTSPDTIVPDPFAQPQPSPRRIVVPKIDVSNSQRWPGAHPLGAHDQDTNNLLRPEYQSRSQSVSSLSKGRGRARGLSVTFTNKPPIVIGEGGDEAQAPPIEISRVRARARSASPVPTPRTIAPESRPWGSPSRRKPLPDRALFDPRSPGSTAPLQGIQRVQTGMSPVPNESKTGLEKEFEMSLGLGSASTTTPTTGGFSPHGPNIISPKPIHPPAPYPNVNNVPALHELKSAHGTVNLRSKFEGRPTRQQSQDPPPGPWQPPRFYEQQNEPPPYSPPGQAPGIHPTPQSRPSADEEATSAGEKSSTGNWI